MICFYELYSFKSGICCVFIHILKLIVAMKKCRHNQSMSRNRNATIKFREIFRLKLVDCWSVLSLQQEKMNTSFEMILTILC